MKEFLRRLDVVDGPEAQEEYFESYCRYYRQRQDAFILVRQLLYIAKAAQRHRGMTMTQLAGNPTFEGDFGALQLQLGRRLSYLCIVAKSAEQLISIQAQQNLTHAWNTINSDWQDDDVVDNFELHSHFIEQVHMLIQSIAKTMELPISALVAEQAAQPELNSLASVTAIKAAAACNDQEAYPAYFKQIELLDFIARQVPNMVEQVARIRGLASYSVAKGRCDDHQKGKIRFAISSARSLSEKLRQQASRLESMFDDDFESLRLVHTFEMKLMYLLNSVEGGVLGSVISVKDSQQLFRPATDVIDAYLTVVEDGIDILARWHEEDLSFWLEN